MEEKVKKKSCYAEKYREIGYKIAYCRKHMNLTQEQLGVSRQHIGAIEAPNIDRKISLDLIFSIADLCEVEPSWFLEYELQSFSENSKK